MSARAGSHGRTGSLATRPGARVFPLFLRLEGRRVLVVGGGTVAVQKIQALLAAGAHVHVVALRANADVFGLVDEGARADSHGHTVSLTTRPGRVTLEERAFAEADVEGAWFVVSATNDPSVNRRVREAAEAQRTFVCAVDDLESASAYFGSVIDRPPFIVALSSRGETPALTRLVREIIEEVLPGPDWIAAARELRKKWKAEKRPMSDRFPELVRKIAQQ